MTRIRSRRSSRIQDRRGGGGGGVPFGLGGRGRGGGLPIPMGAGGGILGLLVIAAVLILPRLLDSGGGSDVPDSQSQLSPRTQGGAVECTTELEQIL